jgi:crotonobetainyl-CoA:carnitine CoA-transferase CaiB-like acyl-CoA transferase
MDVLGAAGVPCGRIRNVAEVCTNPQLVERGKVVERPHPTAGRVQMIGQPIELSETPARIETAAPLLGQQTDAVLREAGYSDAEIRTLRASGAV